MVLHHIFPHGLNLLRLPVTLTAMFIKIPKCRFLKGLNVSLYAPTKMEMKFVSLFTILIQVPVLFRGFTMLMHLLQALPVVALTTLLIQSKIFGLQQKILFLKNMIIDSRIFLMKYLMQNINRNLTRRELNISIL